MVKEMVATRKGLFAVSANGARSAWALSRNLLKWNPHVMFRVGVTWSRIIPHQLPLSHLHRPIWSTSTRTYRKIWPFIQSVTITISIREGYAKNLGKLHHFLQSFEFHDISAMLKKRAWVLSWWKQWRLEYRSTYSLPNSDIAPSHWGRILSRPPYSKTRTLSKALPNILIQTCSPSVFDLTVASTKLRNDPYGATREFGDIENIKCQISCPCHTSTPFLKMGHFPRGCLLVAGQRSYVPVSEQRR